MKKRLLQLFSAVLVVSCFLTSTTFAVSSTTEIENRLAQIIQVAKYKPGSSAFGVNGCWRFVNSVSNILFGINIPAGPNGYKLDGGKGYWSCVDYAYDENATNAAVAQVLKGARPGDIIQYRCSWANWQHTAMIYSNNGSSVTIYDFANSRVYKRDAVLDNLPNTIGDFDGKAGYGITLYRCNHDVATTPIQVGDDKDHGDGGIQASATATTKGADTITETSAVLRGEVRSTGAKITECGMYIGTSENNLKLLGSDKGLSTYGTPCYYSTSKYGYPLQPGMTYYYQVYVVAGGKTVKGEPKSFVTKAPAPTPTLTPTQPPTSDDTSIPPAEDMPDLTPTLQPKPAESKLPQVPDIRLSTSSAKQGETVSVSWTAEPDVYYELHYLAPSSRQGLFASYTTVMSPQNPFTFTILEVGEYRVSVRAQNEYGETESEELTFTVKEDTSVTVTTKGADHITSTDAIVRGQVTTTGKKATQCGMLFGPSEYDLSQLGSDTINATNMPFYYGAQKYGRTLQPGTTYYYRAYAVVDRKFYWGEVKSFTTEP